MMEQGRGPSLVWPQSTPNGHTSPGTVIFPRSGLSACRRRLTTGSTCLHMDTSWGFHTDNGSESCGMKSEILTRVLVASKLRAGRFSSGWWESQWPQRTSVDPTGEGPPLDHGNWPWIRKRRGIRDSQVLPVLCRDEPLAPHAHLALSCLGGLRGVEERARAWALLSSGGATGGHTGMGSTSPLDPPMPPRDSHVGRPSRTNAIRTSVTCTPDAPGAPGHVLPNSPDATQGCPQCLHEARTETKG